MVQARLHFVRGILVMLGASTLVGCTSNRPAAVVDGGESTTDAGRIDSSPTTMSGLVFVATAGVNTPHFAPALGSSSLRIGPVRGGGYGLGEGTLRYRGSTPDGKRIVVGFQSRTPGEEILFALAADGSSADAPVRIARAAALHEDVVISADGSQLLFIDGHALYRARLSGDDVKAPVRVASSSGSAELRNPRWATAAGRAVFEFDRQMASGQTAAVIRSARLDGSDAQTPTVLTETSSGQHRAQTVLPDGRVVASLEKNVLWAIPAAGGNPVRLTPSDRAASLIATIEGGARLVVTLAQTTIWPRRLALVAGDGSLADQPIYLTADAQDLQAVVSADGRLVAYVSRAASSGTWAVFEVRTDTTPAPIQITKWLTSRPYLWAFTPQGAAIVACDNTARTLLRIDRPGSAATAPVVLAQSPLTQPGCASQVQLTTGGSHVLFSGHDASGQWGAHRVPLDGSASPVLLVSGGEARLLPTGVAFFQDLTTAAIFSSTKEGKLRRLTPWHRGPIATARLVDPQRVLYGVTGAEAAWYVATTNGAQAEAPTRITPSGTAGDLVDVVRGRLILRTGDKPQRLLSFGLDGSNASAPVVLADSPAAWELVREPGTLIYSKQGSIRAVPVEGGSPTVVMEGLGDTGPLVYHPATTRVLVAVNGKGVLAARIDGTERTSPILVSDIGNELYGVTVAPHRAFALLTLGTTDTAVPHPLTVITARTDGTDASARKAIAPASYLLFGSNGDWLGTPVPVFVADEASTIMWNAEGLYTARIDGSNATAPLQLAAGKQINLLPGLAPSGKSWVVKVDNRLFGLPLDGSLASRALTPALKRPVTSAVWARGGALVAFRTDDQRVYAASMTGADAASLVELTPASLAVGEAVLTAAPDGSGIIFQMASGPDRSLMLAPLPSAGSAPSVPTAITPVDDAAERVVGFLP